MAKKLTLALGGGGTKGYAHIGVLRQLEQEGYEIAAIAGTSAGGIAGAFYAYGYSVDEIISFIDEIDITKLFSRKRSDAPSLMGLGGLYDFLESKFGSHTFEDLKIPFAVTSVDIRTGKEVIINKGRIVNAVKATTAVPGIFPSLVLKDKVLIDGGVLDPVPVSVARWLCPTHPILAICLSLGEESWSDLPKIKVPSFAPIPSLIIKQLGNLRIGKATQISLESLEIMQMMIAELRLRIDKPDVIIRPLLRNYYFLDDIDPYELIKEGESKVKENIVLIEQARKLNKRITRWMKPTRPPGLLIDEDDY
ncbi:MAG TPA: hypothetical protein G4N92_03240 [Anaerolineae bacterium]|nr:hypothetical protein [Anaerolineae bacterium]